MAYTGHGHYIPGTLKGKGTVGNVVDCGGVEVCPRCKSEIASTISLASKALQELPDESDPDTFAYYRRGERVVIDDAPGAAIQIEHKLSSELDIHPDVAARQTAFYMRN